MKNHYFKSEITKGEQNALKQQQGKLGCLFCCFTHVENALERLEQHAWKIVVQCVLTMGSFTLSHVTFDTV